MLWFDPASIHSTSRDIITKDAGKNHYNIVMNVIKVTKNTQIYNKEWHFDVLFQIKPKKCQMSG